MWRLIQLSRMKIDLPYYHPQGGYQINHFGAASIFMGTENGLWMGLGVLEDLFYHE
jgi:hypothetical protein